MNEDLKSAVDRINQDEASRVSLEDWHLIRTALREQDEEIARLRGQLERRDTLAFPAEGPR